MTVNGVDLSNHNILPDLTPYGFVFNKCTQGVSFADATYRVRHDTVRGLGKVFGAYHFATTESIGSQIAWFQAHANILPGDIVALDFENDGTWQHFTNSQLASIGHGLMDSLAGIYPRNRIVLYCNESTYANIVKPYGVPLRDGLWIADPSNTPPESYVFWQYTSTTVDLDRTSSQFVTLDDLVRWALIMDWSDPLPNPLFDKTITDPNDVRSHATYTAMQYIQGSWVRTLNVVDEFNQLATQVAQLTALVKALPATNGTFTLSGTVSGGGTVS